MRNILPAVILLSCGTAAAAPPVVGGSAVKRGDFPDVVAVLGAEARCTGTLIAPDVVLTAGHCIEINPTEVLIDVIDIDHPSGGERIGVKSARAYPDWEHTYDVGVLVLEHVAITKPRTVAATCTADELLAAQKPVRLVGFGLTTPMASDDNAKLNTAVLPVIDPTCAEDPTCQPSVSPGGEFTAGGRGSDSCFGDSGGPVMFATPGGSVVGGVVSRGLEIEGVPCGNGGVYVRADKVAAWIERATGRKLVRTTCGGPGDDAGSGVQTPDGSDGSDGAIGDGDSGGCNAAGADVAAFGALGGLLLPIVLCPVAIVPGVWRRRRRATTPPR